MGLYAYRPLAAAIRSPAEIAVYYEERVAAGVVGGVGHRRQAVAAVFPGVVQELPHRRPGGGPPRRPGKAVYYEERVEQLLETARQDVTLRFVQGEERDISADHLYDREAAVAYARRWVGERSGDWPDYSRNGGNCQNFVSQCLLA